MVIHKKDTTATTPTATPPRPSSTTPRPNSTPKRMTASIIPLLLLSIHRTTPTLAFQTHLPHTPPRPFPSPIPRHPTPSRHVPPPPTLYATAETTASSPSAERALEKAKTLRAAARKARLEAEQMDARLTLEKIAKLEKRLESVAAVRGGVPSGDAGAVSTGGSGAVDLEERKARKAKQRETEEEEDVRRQIAVLRDHLEESSSPSPSSSASTDSTASTATTLTTLTNQELAKRVKDYLDLPQDIKDMYASAVGMDYATRGYPTFDADAPAIVKKIHREQILAAERSAAETDDDGGTSKQMTELERAAAYAGFWNLPLPLKNTIAHEVGVILPPPPDTDPAAEETKEYRLPALSISVRKKSISPTNPRTDPGPVLANITEVMEALVARDMIRTGSTGVDFVLEGGKDGGVLAEAFDAYVPPPPPSSAAAPKPTTEEERKECERLFLRLPSAMKERIAKSVHVNDLGNTTAIVQRLIEEEKIEIGEDGIGFTIDVGGRGGTGTGVDALRDDGYMQEIMPAATRKFGDAPEREDVDLFFRYGLGKRTFDPARKPEAVPGGYVVWGKNRLAREVEDGTSIGSLGGDELVEALDRVMGEKEELKGLGDRLQVFYMMDPTSADEQTEYSEYDAPVLFVTGKDLAPKTKAIVKPLVSLLAWLCVVGFAAGLFLGEGNVDGVEGLVKEEGLGVWLGESFGPVVGAVLLPSVVHEIMHWIAAIKNQFKIGLPTIVPSLQVGLSGFITPLKTPPKNLNALFDFAAAGPLAGIAVSILLLYTGLEKQVFMDAAVQASLPSVPMELLRSSSLGGGIIEWLLGEGILNSPDPNAVMRLHPYAVGGFVGIVVNALNLLPIGNTDGGRISLALIGRGNSRILSVGLIWVLLLCGIVGVDKSDVLFSYALFASFWQNELEIPCRNEVDGIDDFRAIVAISAAMLTALALVPLNGF